MSKKPNSSFLAQRSESVKSADYYPTPPWAARALLHYALVGEVTEDVNHEVWFRRVAAWEPAAGGGHMMVAMREAFRTVVGSDLNRYELCRALAEDQERGDDDFQYGVDFLLSREMIAPEINFIMTNPPFTLAEDFIQKCLALDPSEGFAMFTRLSFLEGKGRYDSIFRHDDSRPDIVAPFSERVPIVKGRYDPKAASAAAYCWMIWLPPKLRKHDPTRILHIPPCRDVYEKETDQEGD